MPFTLVGSRRADRSHAGVGLLGAVSLALCAGVLGLSFQFRYGEGHRDRPILAVLTLLGAATLCYFAALRVFP